MHEIYLDEAATSMSDPEKRNMIADIISHYINIKWHNPSAHYKPAHWIRGEVERARKVTSDYINSRSLNEIYFTSGGSESNCWAIQGYIHKCLSDPHRNTYPVIITTAIEHKSILECVKAWDNIADIEILPVDQYGFVDTNALREAMEKYKCRDPLVSIQFANNEIGTIQHIGFLATLIHSYNANALFHTDAVQAFGHIEIDVQKLGIDMMSASGHKIGAPKGIGFLYIRDGVQIQPLVFGSQMDSMRGGTENVPGIMAFAEAVECINPLIRSKLGEKQKDMINLLEKRGCRLNGASYDTRLPNNINVTFPDGVYSESLLFLLESAGIYASAGSACNSQSIKPSHVLKAIGLSDQDAARTIRFTLPDNITHEDLQFVLNQIDKAIKILTYEGDI